MRAACTRDTQLGRMGYMSLRYTRQHQSLDRLHDTLQTPADTSLVSMRLQEVMKAVSGKFHPIHQWFYFDSAESLPEIKPGSLDVAPRVSI